MLPVPPLHLLALCVRQEDAGNILACGRWWETRMLWASSPHILWEEPSAGSHGCGEAGGGAQGGFPVCLLQRTSPRNGHQR